LAYGDEPHLMADSRFLGRSGQPASVGSVPIPKPT